MRRVLPGRMPPAQSGGEARARRPMGPDLTVAMVPVGSVEEKVMTWLRRRLEELLGRQVQIGPGMPLPAGSYDASRRQYVSHRLVEALAGAAGPGVCLLGVVDVDLFLPGMNFVLGQAEPGRRAAVVSLFRLRPERYGLPPDEGLFLGRALKESVHELGHLFGLRHCPRPECVMHFSNSLQDTDRKAHFFCLRCQRSLGRARRAGGGR
ncbi:MAG: archaemetzincin [Acetobacteraceae bacterium]|nr:archaemetzincin [Acetobacteraceae bacterium]